MKRTIVLVGVFGLIATLVLPAMSAGAATTYDVAVGQFLASAPAESMRFFPGTVDVHQGDELHFTTESFHTATLLPVGAGVVEWFDTNATLGTSQPYALAQPNPDNGSTAYKFGNNAIFPTDSTCGGPTQSPCAFDGTTVLNSGIPVFFDGPMDWTVTVGAAPGDSFWVVCLVHGANMRMKVNVVATSAPASDPAALDTANAQALAQDTASAAALNAKYSAKQTWHVKGNHRVWDAWAGVDNRHVAVYGMFPRTLKVAKGDTVQWHFDSLTFEDHTVTFPSDKARKIANFFNPVCDPDGDAGPGPDNPPDMMDPPFCTDPTQLEIQLSDKFVPKLGDGTVTGRELESSGVRGAGSSALGGDANYNLRFGATSSGTGFKYICMIHPFMRGRVVVR